MIHSKIPPNSVHKQSMLALRFYLINHWIIAGDVCLFLALLALLPLSLALIRPINKPLVRGTQSPSLSVFSRPLSVVLSPVHLSGSARYRRQNKQTGDGNNRWTSVRRGGRGGMDHLESLQAFLAGQSLEIGSNVRSFTCFSVEVKKFGSEFCHVETCSFSCSNSWRLHHVEVLQSSPLILGWELKQVVVHLSEFSFVIMFQFETYFLLSFTIFSIVIRNSLRRERYLRRSLSLDFFVTIESNTSEKTTVLLEQNIHFPKYN